VRVLALDTTTPRGSLAIVGDGGLLAETRVETASGHSRWLLPAVDALLQGLNLRPGEIDAFAVTTGPGSFTGLRVGLSTVQGLAFASGRPCVGLPALDVLALAAAIRERPVVAVLDAFRGELYWAAYDAAGARRTGPHLGAPAQVLAWLRAEGLTVAPDGVAIVGDLPASERARLAEALEGARWPEVDLYLAAPLGRAALARVAAGETTPASQLRPLYLRGVDIRLPRP
jgi:tRNA threonylcarbamoyladenosine biosynthesis protein TsaB